MRRYYRGLTAAPGRPYKENGRWHNALGEAIRDTHAYFLALRRKTDEAIRAGMGAWGIDGNKYYSYEEYTHIFG